MKYLIFFLRRFPRRSVALRSRWFYYLSPSGVVVMTPPSDNLRAKRDEASRLKGDNGLRECAEKFIETRRGATLNTETAAANSLADFGRMLLTEALIGEGFDPENMPEKAAKYFDGIAARLKARLEAGNAESKE